MGTLDDLKDEVRKINRGFDSTVKKLNERFSSLWMNVQTAHSSGVERLLSSPASKSLDSGAKTIAQGVQNLKSASATAISSSVSGVVEDLKSLRRNVDRNVQALKSGGGGEGMSNSEQPTSPSPSPSPAAAASPIISFPSSKRDMLAGVDSPPGNFQIGRQSFQEPSSTSAPSTSPNSSSDEVPEEDPHPDLSSVSATSVFSIGYVGPPLLGPQEPSSFVYDANDVPRAPSIGMASVGTDTTQEVSGLAPVVRLEDVRKSLGKALVVYRKIRALGFRESSWENKMPWRNPRAASLAKGLNWPQQKFSSVGERHEYHRRARRRGRYLIGPTPGWSWFAADIVFLYFLINNPAGNFLI